MSTPIQGASKGSRRAANALHKGMHDDLLAQGLTLDQVVEKITREHSDATESGVRACLQVKLDEGRLVINDEGILERVRRCDNRRSAIFAVATA